MYATHQSRQPYSAHNFEPFDRDFDQHQNNLRWSFDDPRAMYGNEQLWTMDTPIGSMGYYGDGSTGIGEGGHASERIEPPRIDDRFSYSLYTSNAGAPLQPEASSAFNPYEPSNSQSTQLQGPSSFEQLSLFPQPDYSYLSEIPSAPTYPYPDSNFGPSLAFSPSPARPSTSSSAALSHYPDQALDVSHTPFRPPSFDNLPFRADLEYRRPNLQSSQTSLSDSFAAEQQVRSTPTRGRPVTATERSTPTRTLGSTSSPRHLTPRRPISVDVTATIPRQSNHSPTGSLSRYPLSPFRSFPSPLSPTRKRQHSDEDDSTNPRQHLYDSFFSKGSLGPSYAPVYGGGGGGDASSGSDEARSWGYESTGIGLERRVGELQLASRPSSSQAFQPQSYDGGLSHEYAPIDGNEANELRKRREHQIRAYLAADNKLKVGERTVLILNPRIAQRSYGTERRLLNPPPMAYLLGSSWFSTSQSEYSSHLPSPPTRPRIASPPEVFISIYPPRNNNPDVHVSKEAIPNSTWMSLDGRNVVEQNEDTEPPIAGRLISKSLAVALDGDLNKDTISDVKTVVTIVDRSTQLVVGTFFGERMTVISKPSKKKSISAGATAGLVNGGLVALFNRAKAGTGSTRYLCTSGVQSNFPSTDWRDMTSNAPRPFAPQDTRDVRFISKTHSWDAFVIYVVDVTLPTSNDTSSSFSPPHEPGYPRPPSNIFPVNLRKPQALYYNQTVVLQCLSTGVVSPVLILRRIDSKATAIGGGSLEPSTAFADVARLPVAPGEQIGEPVSQYKSIAFEVYQQDQPRSPSDLFGGPTSTFLGCVSDEIGIHVAEGKRTIVKSESPPLTSPSPELLPPSQFRHPLYASTNSYVPSPNGFDSISEDSSDGSDSKRKRARTSTTAHFSTTPLLPSSPPTSNRPTNRHRRRGQSLSSLAALQKARSPSPNGSGAVWTIPCGEACVWSILAIDLARHTYYIPPSVDGGTPAPYTSPSEHSHLYSTPVPATPVGPAIPSASRIEYPVVGAAEGTEQSFAVLHGKNLHRSFVVWVGDQPCPHQIQKSTSLLLFQPPPLSFATSDSRADRGRRISFVREDGVVFPTSTYYRE